MRALIRVTLALAVVGVGCDPPVERAEETGLPGTSIADAPPPTLGLIDDARIINADSEPGNWLAHGRTYEEQRFSPLTQINRDNVSDLGLAWFRDMGTNRGQEATPIIVDGTMFVTSAWSRVYAIDAVTGDLKWSYDPEVPGEWGRRACCDVVNRGVAVYQGRVYVGSLDGRLIALDAATGVKVWEVDTLIDRDRFYSITGAPRAAGGKVFIGNGGAEFGVRGYVTAYDAETGEQAWVSSPSPATPRCRSSTPRWRWRQRPGEEVSGGRSEAAGRPGTRLSMTQTSTRCIWASATGHRGPARYVHPAGATICSSRRSSPWMSTRAA